MSNAAPTFAASAPPPASHGAAERGALAGLRRVGGFVRVSHTVFSLPLVMAGMWVGAAGWPAPRTLILALIAAIGARTLAMALNRIIDRRIDALNPRTASRELPSGRLRLAQGWAVAAVGLALYLAACAALGRLILLLSPLPLLVFWGYPYLKRFTPLCHFGVGLALGISPLAGWIAVTGGFDGWERVLPLGLFGIFWVAGFDVIYATLDETFDRAHGIHSLPAALGRVGALRVSALLHLLAFGSLVALWLVQGWTVFALVPLSLCGALLFVEQRMAENVELAFFRINLVVGFAVLAMVGVGVFAR